MEFKFPGYGYKEIFNHSTAPMLIVRADAPRYTMLDVNRAYLAATNTIREDLIGKGVFDVFPANPSDNQSKNIERVIDSFEQALQTRMPHTMSNYRYDIPIPGTDEFEERYWTTTNTPVINDQGEVLYFIHSPANVTELYKLSERQHSVQEALENQRRHLYATFMQAPVGIAIFRGPDHRVDLVNPPMCELYGKSDYELMGKPVFEVLEQVRRDNYRESIDAVYRTGKSFKGTAFNVPVYRDGKRVEVFLNFIFEPFREHDGEISGVISIATEVSELVNAKNKIEEAEVRTRLAVDAVEMGTFDLDLITGEMITSPVFAKIFGFESPVARSKYIEVFHQDDLELRKRAHAEALQSGRLLYEARVLWSDKSIHWVRIEGKVIYDKDGKPVRIPGILLDITAQKNAREEQRKLISLVENSEDFMAILEFNGTHLFINETGRKLFGFPENVNLSEIPVTEIHADPLKLQQEVIPAVLANGKWGGNMFVRHLNSGEIIPVYKNCFRIDDPVSGEPIAIGVVMRDLRPELQAQQALANSEMLLRNITSAAPTGLWMSDADGLITYVNQTWIDWNGNKFEDNLGTGWTTNIVEEDRSKTTAKFLHDLSARQQYEVEFRINHADGTIHWCLASGQPQQQADGKFTGYIGACMDITELKILQQQKDNFIAIASHELKTPVTSIKGYTQVLEKMLRQKGDLKEAMMMSRMDTQVRRLTSLISDLLDVTKISAGKLQFNDRQFELNPLVHELIEDLQRTTDKHLIIEEFEENGFVYADKERIIQVITNLVSNAIKYSPVAENIIVRTFLEGNNVVLSVKDQGIGIAKDQLEKVFEQFYRVSGDMQHTFPGLGLGLYISAQIIQREGGRIWAESSPGHGSTFCFSLPQVTDNV